MIINIKNRTDAGLCGNCKHSIIISSKRGLEKIYCREIGDGIKINFLVTECNSFEDMRFQYDYDFKEIGWILEVKNKKIMGFKPPRRN